MKFTLGLFPSPFGVLSFLILALLIVLRSKKILVSVSFRSSLISYHNDYRIGMNNTDMKFPSPFGVLSFLIFNIRFERNVYCIMFPSPFGVLSFLI